MQELQIQSNSTAIIFHPHNSSPISQLDISNLTNGQHYLLGNFRMDYHTNLLLPRASIRAPVVNARPQCLVGNLINIFKSGRWEAFEIHCIFKEFFGTHTDATLTGDILKCYIALLEAIAAEAQKGLSRVFIHISSNGQMKRRAFSKFWRESEECNVGIQYEHFHDVLMKSIHLYSLVYKDIYHLNIIYVGH